MRKGVKAGMKHMDEELAVLKAEYAELVNLHYSIWRAIENKKDADKKVHDETCPRCKRTDVIDDIKRVQGSLDGSVSGSSFLLSGSLYGSVHGGFDTNDVSVCKNCGNVWKKLKDDSDGWEKATWELFGGFWRYWNCMDEAENATFDPSDITEMYRSLEEKRSSRRCEASVQYRSESPLRKFHVETVMTFVKNRAFSHSGNYSFARNISDWTRSKFAKWGCLEFPTTARSGKPGVLRRLMKAIGFYKEAKRDDR